MGKRIELPRLPEGSEQEQLQSLYSYLYQMAQTLNNNLAEIGGAELTDEEMQAMQQVIGTGDLSDPMYSEAETLKSLIIKTASFVQSQLNEYRLNLLGEYVAEGKFGKYVRRTGLDVDVTPTGITQNYSFQEIIQDLKRYEVNAKNYIKTGLLRTVSSVPVYGVAIGKDIVTFSQDGTETYNDGNKVAELTADELSFWQNSVKIASYTGNKISFLYNGSEAMYIQNGKIYCTNDMEVSSGKKVKIQNVVFDENGMEIEFPDSDGKMFEVGLEEWNDSTVAGIFATKLQNNRGANIRLRNRSLNPQSVAEFSFWHGPVSVSLYPNQMMSQFYISGLGNKVIGSNSQNIDCEYLRNIIAGKVNKTSTQEWRRVQFVFGNIIYPGANDPFPSGTPILSIAHDPDSASLSNYIVITAENKKIKIGDTSNYVYIEVLHYISLVQESSRDVKHDIQDMESAGDRLDQLRPVTYIYNNDPEEKKRQGLIYEEAIEVMPEICTENDSEKAVNYMELVPILLKEIQDLRARVKALEEKGGQ